MRDEQEEVILVDQDDRETGRAGKIAAHKFGYRHRAISVCVVDQNGRMLLQRRAREKYHSAGLWTNACCTHPRPGEAVRSAAERRLNEELGVSCPLRWRLRTHYQAPVGADLIENEVVHLFVGSYGGNVLPNPHEVEAYAWRTRPALLAEMRDDPDAYTYWFKHYVRSFVDDIFGGAAN